MEMEMEHPMEMEMEMEHAIGRMEFRMEKLEVLYNSVTIPFHSIPFHSMEFHFPFKNADLWT